MRRATVVALAAIVIGLLALPAFALAVPILEPADAEDLAQTLAEATEEQDVCYGWEVDVRDDSGEGPSGVEGGSSFGAGQPLDRARCPRYVVLQGAVTYTSEASESEDSAEIAIDSNLANPPTVADLGTLGFDANGLLSDTEDDVNLLNLVEVLPLLVAEHGQAPFVAFEPRREPLPAEDVPTASPGNDWLRTFWWVPVIGALGVLALLLVLGSLRNRRRRTA